MRKIPRFVRALVLAFACEALAAWTWFAGGPYSSVDSTEAFIGRLLHYPGIALLLRVPAFSGAPDAVLFGFPPLLSFLLWLFFWLGLLTMMKRRRNQER